MSVINGLHLINVQIIFIFSTLDIQLFMLNAVYLMETATQIILGIREVLKASLFHFKIIEVAYFG